MHQSTLRTVTEAFHKKQNLVKNVQPNHKLIGKAAHYSARLRQTSQPSDFQLNAVLLNLLAYLHIKGETFWTLLREGYGFFAACECGDLLRVLTKWHCIVDFEQRRLENANERLYKVEAISVQGVEEEMRWEGSEVFKNGEALIKINTIGTLSSEYNVKNIMQMTNKQLKTQYAG
jgi:hypothetical protein